MSRWIMKQKGVTQVEFTLISLAVLLVIFAIIEFALYFYSIQMVNEITRRSARLATVCYISDYSDIPEMPAIKGLYPPGFTKDNLTITFIKHYKDDDSGDIVIEELTDTELGNFTNSSDDANFNTTFSRIRYVKAKADYTFKFFVLSWLINAVGVSPSFETILPAESLGVLRPEGVGVREDC